jgi:hypothetical protein
MLTSILTAVTTIVANSGPWAFAVCFAGLLLVASGLILRAASRPS